MQIEKDICEFHKHKYSNDGYRCHCKECRKKETKDKYLKNPELYKEKSQKYRKNNPDKIKEGLKKYRIKNLEKLNERKRLWSKSESGKKSKKKYYERNSETLKKKVKEYRQKNPDIDSKKRKTEKYKKWMTLYKKKHREKNPHYYLWRSVLRNTLKRIGTKKEGKTIELLGYSAQKLKEHIEKQFVDSMSWDNCGEWHIDHITPVSSFDKSEKLSIINSLDNLQPLWAKDNLKKSNKLINKK